MKTVRLYGLTHGYGSYAQVLRGFEAAFAARGYGPDRLETISLEVEDEEARPRLPTARAAVFLGPPTAASAMRKHASHEVRCVMVAPNSDRLPEPTMRVVAEHATHVLAPSTWAAGIISKYTERPVLVVPHGVHDGFRPPPTTAGAPNLETAYEAGEFRVLHLSSSTRERKGTLELIQAWRRLRRNAVLPQKSRLGLVVVPETRARILDWCASEEESLENLGLSVGERLGEASEGAGPAELAKIYARAHLVCQPSRGEAFGMIPLEALATGVPIVATNVTGHRQWWGNGPEGAVPVHVGAYQPIDDLPGATAPALFVKDLADALAFAYKNWHKLKAAALVDAERIRRAWAWPKQLDDFVHWLERKIA